MLDKQSYSRWDKLPRSVKTNKPIEENEGGRGSAGSMFDQARSNQAIEQMQVFTRAMYGVSVGPAIALAKIFDFSNYKKLMNIGAGSGVYAIEVVKENPNMSATVLDLGPACEVANEYTKTLLGNKLELKLLADDDVKVAIAMNEKIAGIAFPDLKGKMDFNSGFTSSSIDFHKWCNNVFSFFWARSKKPDLTSG
jgi:hypothetical protein